MSFLQFVLAFVMSLNLSSDAQVIEQQVHHLVDTIRYARQLSEIPLFDRRGLTYCRLEGTRWTYVVDGAEGIEFSRDWVPVRRYREVCPN